MIVYIARYLDLFYFHRFTMLHIYNFIMKLLFLGSQAAVLYFSWFRFRATYSGKLDTFRIEALILPCLLLGWYFEDSGPRASTALYIREIFWTFSILLESVAILPQMFLLQKTGEAETITTHYLMALGAYRGFYLLNWIWRMMFKSSPEPIVVLAGIVQTALYSDFFYIYYKRYTLYCHPLTNRPLVSSMVAPSSCQFNYHKVNKRDIIHYWTREGEKE